MGLDLVDIGVNLAHDSFDADRDAVIDRAIDAGTRRMIVTGSSVQVSRDAVALARQRPGVLYATAGIHPHHATEYSDRSIPALAGLLTESEVVAVGECGLDFFRDFSPREMQLAAFEAQVELACQQQRPLFLHQREAHDTLVEILKNRGARLPAGVAHCFTGSISEVTDYLDLGLHIGITGWICDERRGLHLRDVVKEIPLDRLLIETDAPYLLPRDLDPKPRSRRNEPAFLPHILETIATAVGISVDELGAVTTNNARQLFTLDDHK